MKPRIAKFGFEIEAEMTEELARELSASDYGQIKGDGSIRNCSYEETGDFHHESKAMRCYEFATKPIDEGKAGRMKAGKILMIMERAFRKKEFHWNKTMGMHIHVSFKPKTPVDIWSVEFSRLFFERMEKEFPTALRDRKANPQYCKVINDEKTIAFGRDRYVAINYYAAYRKFGTVEFRIFPSNRPMTMRRYLKFTLDFIQEFLENSHLYLKKDYEEIFDDTVHEKEVIDSLPKREYERHITSSLQKETNELVITNAKKDLFKMVRNNENLEGIANRDNPF